MLPFKKYLSMRPLVKDPPAISGISHHDLSYKQMTGAVFFLTIYSCSESVSSITQQLLLNARRSCSSVVFSYRRQLSEDALSGQQQIN
jgi:hypothetical protein